MKTRIMIKNLGLALLTVFLMLVSVSGYSQACTGNQETVTLANITQGANFVEYDVMLSNTGTTSLRISAASIAVLFNTGVLPPGATGSASIVVGPVDTGNFPGHTTAPAANYSLATRSIRYGGTPNASSTTMLTSTPIRYVRIRFSSTLNWLPNTALTLTVNPLQGTPNGATTPGTTSAVYCNGNTASSTTLSNFTTPGTIVVGAPVNVILSPTDTCFTSGAAGSIVGTTCFGQTTGSAVITMSPTPSSNAITYTVDGGASTSGTLVANAFSVSALTAGDHTVVVTGSGTCTTSRTVNFTVGGPLSPLTNVTNQTACDSFTWLVTGQTYTISGAYTGTTTNGSGCTVSETLNLTINNSTSSSMSATSCDSYTWAANGTTYTTSGTYTNVTTNAAGCPDTATLVLTINNSTSSSMSATACDSYTWSANGTIYTTSGTYTNITTNGAGCPDTATLVLIINNSTTDNSLTITANDTYTWSLGIGGNGTTYTTSGVYTFVTSNAAGCPNTATLTLTINITGIPTTWYQDFDGDNYGNPAVTLSSVGQPIGYVANNTDCNDAVAAINPGIAEVLYNGVDDNCDGNLDEGFQLKTKVLPAQCGATLTTLGSLIGVTTLLIQNNITGYRFRVTNGASVQTIDRVVPNFSLTMLASSDYATTYTVEVQLQRNGVWLGYYGDACLVSSPAILASNGAAQVSPSQCGITLPSISTLIATTSLAGVTGYRYRITRAGDVGPNAVQILDRTLNWFSLTMLTQYNYGSAYTVEVAVKTTGAYSGFGNPCVVSSPASPSLVICGGTVASAGTLVYCQSLNLVTQYRFQITRLSDNTVTTIDRNLNSFSFNQVPGYTAGTQYGVRVAVRTVNTWSAFGDACQITAPGVLAPRFASSIPTVVEFKVVASPNPFAADFKLNVTTSSEELVQVKVYDMIGKQIESREVKVSDLSTQEVGSTYPSGVYNVIVSQGNEVKTLRVIKR